MFIVPYFKNLSFIFILIKKPSLPLKMMFQEKPLVTVSIIINQVLFLVMTFVEVTLKKEKY